MVDNLCAITIEVLCCIILLMASCTNFSLSVSNAEVASSKIKMGGFFNTAGWIDAAADLNIGWWITSSLETAYGLNAISQFVAQYNPQIPQGLGTGSIFTNSPKSPLKVLNGLISYDFSLEWEQP